MDERVYVNVDDVRGREFINEIMFNLKIENNKLKKSDIFTKIIFSGHRGTGKTIELKRFHQNVDHPDKYFSIFIEIESEFEVSNFQPEDLLIVLISNLIEGIHQNNFDFRSKDLDEILQEWTSDEEIRKELIEDYRIDIDAEVRSGASFFGFLKLKGALKNIFSKDSITSHMIRQNIKKNTPHYIKKLNSIFHRLRHFLIRESKSNGLLFIIDGSERIPYKIYRELFIENSSLIKLIECDMMFSVPINACYDISSNIYSEFFHLYALPMVPIFDKSIPLLEEIITKRIDSSRFIEKKALRFCVEKSGGCIRQLLRLVNRALIISLGKKISMDDAKKSAYFIGKSMYDLLDYKHIKILQSGRFMTADRKIKDLLFSLVILDYHNSERIINPLLLDWIEIEKR